MKFVYVGNINVKILVKNFFIVFVILKIKNVVECFFEVVDKKVEIVESFFEGFKFFFGKIKIIEKNLV